MPLHQLMSITIGVPDVAAVSAYYTDFGLHEVAPRMFATQDGAEQLRIEYAPTRKLIALDVGVDTPDDLGKTAFNLTKCQVAHNIAGNSLSTIEPVTKVKVTLLVAPRLKQEPGPLAQYNRPGRIDRPDQRADCILRTQPVSPRRLGHIVIGSTDADATRGFFTDGLGFRVSDEIPGLAAFMRCSTDHHNVLVQAAPANFLHHTAWEVQDIDEVGRGAMAMLEEHPERHVWGLGRHHIGSNFFWYLRDPAGNFSEYYSDLDRIIEDQLCKPETVDGPCGLYSWGPPPPPSFIYPEDLAGLMTGSHTLQ